MVERSGAIAGARILLCWGILENEGMVGGLSVCSVVVECPAWALQKASSSGGQRRGEVEGRVYVPGPGAWCPKQAHKTQQTQSKVIPTSPLSYFSVFTSQFLTLAAFSKQFLVLLCVNGLGFRQHTRDQRLHRRDVVDQALHLPHELDALLQVAFDLIRI